MVRASHRQRLLLGPLDKAEWSEYMVGAFDDYDTLTFGAWSGADIQLPGLNTLDEILAALPAGWQPDYFILWRPEYGAIPPGLETAPFPVAMMVSDWYIAFTDTLEAAWRVDLIITGTRGERVLRAAGFDHVVARPMLGYQPEVDGTCDLPHNQRDIDIYVGGNPNWTVHRQREQIIATLLTLPDHVNIRHGKYVDRAAFNHLLGRSKIVVDQTVIGEINMKVYEATAAGACLFVEEDNLDMGKYLVPDESVVLFNQHNLREKILYYLDHPIERETIARRGQQIMQQFTYRENFHQMIDCLRDKHQRGVLPPRRPCFELDAAARAHGLLGFLIRHGNGDWPAVLDLAADPVHDTGRGPLLRTTAHYYASTHGAADVWESSRILDAFANIHRQTPDDFPAAYCWAQVAAVHLDAHLALPAMHHVIQLLRQGCAIPLSCADVLLCDKATRYTLERTAWEAVEQGVAVDEALRPLLLADALVTFSQLADTSGRRDEGLATLKLAVAQDPKGQRARPVLAAWLAEAGQGGPAAAVWREHLRVHPLDFGAMEELAAVARTEATVELTKAEIRRYQRGRLVMEME